MNEDQRIKCFARDLDDILEGKEPVHNEGISPEYAEVLDLASMLTGTDFSAENGGRERIKRKLSDRCQGRRCHKFNKEVGMNKLWKERRPAVIIGTAAVIAVMALALIFPGTMMAMANNAADNITKILHIGKYATVMQMEDSGNKPATPLLTAEQKAKLQAGEIVTIKTPDGDIAISGAKAGDEEKADRPGVVHYAALADAQKAASFQILTPEYLPQGYAFKEAQGYEGSGADGARDYANLYYKGPGKDIILMERIMHEKTRFEESTGGKIEAVDINGATGAWMEPHTLVWEKDGVNVHLFCKGFSKEKALKIARSVK